MNYNTPVKNKKDIRIPYNVNAGDLSF